MGTCLKRHSHARMCMQAAVDERDLTIAEQHAKVCAYLDVNIEVWLTILLHPHASRVELLQKCIRREHKFACNSARQPHCITASHCCVGVNALQIMEMKLQQYQPPERASRFVMAALL